MTRRFRLLVDSSGAMAWSNLYERDRNCSATGLATNTKERNDAARLPEMHLKHRDAGFFV